MQGLLRRKENGVLKMDKEHFPEFHPAPEQPEMPLALRIILWIIALIILFSAFS
jgi:hypothetical protein